MDTFFCPTGVLISVYTSCDNVPKKTLEKATEYFYTVAYLEKLTQKLKPYRLYELLYWASEWGIVGLVVNFLKWCYSLQQATLITDRFKPF